MNEIALDADGFPVMLAKAEPPTETKPPPPSHPPASVRPAVVSHLEWARRQDAVREAAREFEDLTDQDVRERLRGLTSKPLTASELAQFRVDVRHQVVDDLVDVLDQQERGRLRGRRTVRLAAPRGYTRKAMKSLTASESADIRARLEARGWDSSQLKTFDKKLPEPAPADEFSFYVEHQHGHDEEQSLADLASAVAAIQPSVVHVTSAPRGPRKMVLHRDEKGLLSSVEVIEDAR